MGEKSGLCPRISLAANIPMCVARAPRPRHAGLAAAYSLRLTLMCDMVMTVETQGTGEGDQMQAAYLEKPADELAHRGLEAWLMAPPGRVPSLDVGDPSARALAAHVYGVRGVG